MALILMPKESDIPIWIERNPAYEVIKEWFYSGGIRLHDLPALRNTDYDRDQILPYICHHFLIRDYEHNYKMRGCAYLLWQFFNYGNESGVIVKSEETPEERKERWIREIRLTAHLDVAVQSLVEDNVDYNERVNYLRVEFRREVNPVEDRRLQLYEEMHVFPRDVSHKDYVLQGITRINLSFGGHIVSAGLIKDRVCYGGAASLRIYANNDKYDMSDTEMFQLLKPVPPAL